jgi:hypothetical protein
VAKIFFLYSVFLTTHHSPLTTFSIIRVDATAKSPKNAAKTMPTPQNRGGKVLLTLASVFYYFSIFPTLSLPYLNIFSRISIMPKSHSFLSTFAENPRKPFILWKLFFAVSKKL